MGVGKNFLYAYLPKARTSSGYIYITEFILQNNPKRPNLCQRVKGVKITCIVRVKRVIVGVNGLLYIYFTLVKISISHSSAYYGKTLFHSIPANSIT